MAAPNVANIVEARIQFMARTETPELHCADCTAFIGRMPSGHNCLGSIEAQIRSTHPQSVVHD